MQKIGIIVSTIHAKIKFHTPYGIGTVFSTYEPNKVEEGQKKVKETIPTKDVLSYVDAEERIIVNEKYPKQTVVIKMQLPTSYKRKLHDLLGANVDIFVWTYVDMTGISRTIMESGIPLRVPAKVLLGCLQEGLFLGHLITKQGIKANPLKVKAITDWKPPKIIKEMQILNEKLATLSRFFSKGSYKSLPFFKALNSYTGKKTLQWTANVSEVLVMYLAASAKSISVVLLAKREKRQVSDAGFANSQEVLQLPR
ncbi:hypothetical protein Tco_0793619 [Tanacetum coccineum]